METLFTLVSIFFLSAGSVRGEELKTYVYDDAAAAKEPHKTSIFLKELGSGNQCQTYLVDLRQKVKELVLLINTKRFHVTDPFRPERVIRARSLWSQKVYLSDMDAKLKTRLTEEGASLSGLETVQIIEIKSQSLTCGS